MKIAEKFNQAIKNGEIGPVVLGRDHHDVSGTDSPYRETSIFMTEADLQQIWQFIM
jgi:urocanate hydratase